MTYRLVASDGRVVMELDDEVYEDNQCPALSEHIAMLFNKQMKESLDF